MRKHLKTEVLKNAAESTLVDAFGGLFRWLMRLRMAVPAIKKWAFRLLEWSRRETMHLEAAWKLTWR